jgi:hypothetical protein
MKKTIITTLVCAFLTFAYSQELKTIQLSPPDTNRGLPVMKA